VTKVYRVKGRETDGRGNASLLGKTAVGTGRRGYQQQNRLEELPESMPYRNRQTKTVHSNDNE
jgi:hypothetical protein